MNRHVDVDRIVYATITLMSVLVIYDGWSSLKLLQLAGVVVGPRIRHVPASLVFWRHGTAGRRR
jgi:hypothetical protein